IGFGGITAEDDAFFFPNASSARRQRIEQTIPMVTGDAVRDYSVAPEIASIWPYDTELKAAPSDSLPSTMRAMWPNRRILQRRKRFGKFIETIPTITWYEYGELYREKLKTPHSITFGFVSTHNHFAFDRGGKVFKQSAPLVKLSENASETDYLSLLGLLNSSTACFWLKMISHDKGSQGVNEGFKSQDWERFYEFTGTKLQRFPIPQARPQTLNVVLDSLARKLASSSPCALATTEIPRPAALLATRNEWHSTRARMIALQEELDWQVYSLYNLHSEDLRAPESQVPELALGERAFEIVLARRVEKGEASDEWFTRHGSTPITTLPDHWSDAYKAIVQKRIDA
ncbi:BREX-2 system adenine-specific DNA-methyltransferase PglX, partial [Nocardia sp. NPDC003354]